MNESLEESRYFLSGFIAEPPAHNQQVSGLPAE
jgi:hypothetical protein